MSDGIRRHAISAFTHCDVCCSGRHVEIGFNDHRGRPIELYLPHECLDGLIWALPAAGAEAAHRRGGDAGLDTVERLAGWQLQQDGDQQATLLRLERADGIAVAFRLPLAAAAALGVALLGAPGVRQASSGVMPFPAPRLARRPA